MNSLDKRALLLALSIALPVALAGTARADDAASDPVVATVDGAQIHKSDVLEAYRGSPFAQAPIEQVFPQVLEMVIATHLLDTEALNNKLDQDPTVKSEIAGAESSILAEAYMEKRVSSMVSEKDVQDRYQQLVKTFQGKSDYHLFHILTNSEADAKAVIADLDKGAKFADEAKAKSADPNAKANGGDLGFFGDDDMNAIPGMADAVAKLKPGEYTRTPLQTQFGWQVLMVSETRPAQPPTIDQVRPDITGALQQEAEQKLVADLTSAAKIQRFDDNGKPLPPPSNNQAPAAP